MRRFVWTFSLTFLCHTWATGQTLKVRPPGSAEPGSAQPASNSNLATTRVPSIPLTVPVGTPLKVALDREIRVGKVGQPVHGKVIEPVYAFDELVVPAGSEVNGKIAQIEAVSKKKRTIAAMNGDFSPYREVHIDFDELVLADGHHMPLQTSVSRGSGGVLQFVPAGTQQKVRCEERG